jgi:hypothetical protein
MKRAHSAWILFASLHTLVACTVPMEEDEEELSTDTQADTQNSCTDSSVSLLQPNGAAVNFQYPRCSFADSAATSTSYTYDQPLCRNKFVTEVRQVNGRAFTPFVEVVPPAPITAQNVCEAIVIVGEAWGDTSNNNWTSLGSITTVGVWHPAACGPFLCIPASCQLRFNISSSKIGFTRVRVAGFGASLGLFKGIVRTGVNGGPGPC